MGSGNTDSDHMRRIYTSYNLNMMVDAGVLINRFRIYIRRITQGENGGLNWPPRIIEVVKPHPVAILARELKVTLLI